MAAITGDGVTVGSSEWLLDYTNRLITKNSAYMATTRHTVQELYSWVMDLFDNASQMDDTIPMAASTPTEYSLINGWYIPEVSYGYLTGGSIKSLGYNAGDGTGGTYTNGIVSVTISASTAAATDIGKPVTCVGGSTGVLVDYNNTATVKYWKIRRTAGTVANFTGTATITGGTAGQGTLSSPVTGEDIWGNFYTLGTIESGGVVY